MLMSEKFALAARIHVLLRRQTGRVTDTEWMIKSPEYAAEIVRFSRDCAAKEGHTDLAELATKLADIMLPPKPAVPAYKKPELSFEGQGLIRYVRGLR